VNAVADAQAEPANMHEMQSTMRNNGRFNSFASFVVGLWTKCLSSLQKERTMSENNSSSLIAASATGLAGELTESGHRLHARVYYADTDFSGLVYHARYLEFLERGRTDYLRLLGVHHTELAGGILGESIVWVVRRMEIEFKSAARIDDILTIETRTAEISGARVRMAQSIRRGEDLLIAAEVEAAMINGAGRPRRFPAEWINLFQPALQK
jgi:acyl-CoA thioester hydrolase